MRGSDRYLHERLSDMFGARRPFFNYDELTVNPELGPRARTRTTDLLAQITAQSASWGTHHADTRRYRAAEFGSRLGLNESDRSGKAKRSADDQDRVNRKKYQYSRYPVGFPESRPPDD